MLPRHLALMVAICFAWALNSIVSKLVVTQMGVPPLFYAAIRSAVVAAAVFPWLLPMPRPRLRLLVVALLMGGGGFALFYVGIETASPSAAAIVLQMGVPIATLLSVILLGERIRWRRALGSALTFTGAMLVMWDPDGFSLSVGLLFVAASAFAGSLGAVMMKQIEGARPLQLQAWVGLTAVLPLAVLSALLEPEPVQHAIRAGWPFVAALAYSALVVSVLGHTLYYGLIQTYEANLIAPLTLMNPLFTIALGALLTGDRIDGRMVLGASLALTGVLVIALRRNHLMSLLLLRRVRR